MTSPKVIGLDLSIRATGVARVDGSTLVVRAVRLEGYRRHYVISQQVMKIVRADGPDLVVVEDYAPHSPGINSTIRLAELGGIVRTALETRGYRWATVKPNTLKLWATGRGNADKTEMIAAAYSMGAPQPMTTDEADAWLCRAYGTAHYEELAK